MICFRPLLGVPISQYGKIIMLYCKAKGFRPLLGVPISQYGEDAFNKTIQFAVSVPSSGFLYLNLLGERSNGKSYATVSVPSSGFLYLNNEPFYILGVVPKFPSPPRGSYISIAEDKKLLNDCYISFRPLLGVPISQSCPLYPLKSLGCKAGLRRKTKSGSFHHISSI